MKYRKKPVVIDAFKMTESSLINQCVWPTWLSEAVASGAILFIAGEAGPADKFKATDIMQILTLEGTMTVSLNDWIIKGAKGELYPCKPDILEAIYEKTDLENA